MHQVDSKFISILNNYNIFIHLFLCRKEKEDLELENLELRQKLNLKSTELMNLQQELKEKTALLSLNELRIQQVSLHSFL